MNNLESRMKMYEHSQRFSLMRKIPVIIRIDGKAFHTYTKGLEKPFDYGLVSDMQNTAIHLCKNIQGAKCAYVQSDEISILLTDYDTYETQAWFNYELSKVESISASLASSYFNIRRIWRDIEKVGDNISIKRDDVDNVLNIKLANFDSRARNYSKEEVANYFLWRQQDAKRNSIQALAQSLYSANKLHKASQVEMLRMIVEKGKKWSDLPEHIQRGSFIVKNTYVNGELSSIKNGMVYYSHPYERWVKLNPEDKVTNVWEVVETPVKFNNSHFQEWL